MICPISVQKSRSNSPAKGGILVTHEIIQTTTHLSPPKSPVLSDRSSRYLSSSMSTSSQEIWGLPNGEDRKPKSRSTSASPASSRIRLKGGRSQMDTRHGETAALQCHGLDLPDRPSTAAPIVKESMSKVQPEDNGYDSKNVSTAEIGQVLSHPTLCKIPKSSRSSRQDVGIQVTAPTPEQDVPHSSPAPDIPTTRSRAIKGTRSDANLADAFLRAMKEKKPFSWNHHHRSSGHNTPRRGASPVVSGSTADETSTCCSSQQLEGKILAIEAKVDQLGPAIEKLTCAVDALTVKVDSAINSPTSSRYTSSCSTTQNGYTSFWREKQQNWPPYRRASALSSSRRPSTQTNVTSKIDELRSDSRSGSIRVMHRTDIDEDEGHISVEELIAPAYRQRQMSRWDTETEEETDDDPSNKTVRKPNTTNPSPTSAAPSHSPLRLPIPTVETSIAARRKASGNNAPRQLTAIRTSYRTDPYKIAQVLPDLSPTRPNLSPTRPNLSLIPAPPTLTNSFSPKRASVARAICAEPSPRSTQVLPLSPLSMHPSSQSFNVQPATPGFYFFYGTLSNPSFLADLLNMPTPPVLKPAYVWGKRTKYYGTYPVAVPSDLHSIEGVAFYAHTPEIVEALRCYAMYCVREEPTEIVLADCDGEVLRGRMFMWIPQGDDDAVLTDGPAI